MSSGNSSSVESGPHGEVRLAINGYEAKCGFDLLTGLGTVDAFAFAHELAGRRWQHEVADARRLRCAQLMRSAIARASGWGTLNSARMSR